jgi:DNA-binding response OmpR family regulator
MEVLVCHRQKALVHLARINAERHGVKVRIAPRPKDVLTLARADKPDMILLGNDLKDPTTEELVKALDEDFTLRGVQVIVVKGAIPDLAGSFKKLKWPTPPV